VKLVVTSKALLRYLATQPPSFTQAARGGGGGQDVGARVPMAQGLKRHSQGPRPCNTEGVRGV